MFETCCTSIPECWVAQVFPLPRLCPNHHHPEQHRFDWAVWASTICCGNFFNTKTTLCSSRGSQTLQPRWQLEWQWWSSKGKASWNHFFCGIHQCSFAMNNGTLILLPLVLLVDFKCFPYWKQGWCVQLLHDAPLFFVTKIGLWVKVRNWRMGWAVSWSHGPSLFWVSIWIWIVLSGHSKSKQSDLTCWGHVMHFFNSFKLILGLNKLNTMQVQHQKQLCDALHSIPQLAPFDDSLTRGLAPSARST